jgi:GcrA cell cycle regulator
MELPHRASPIVRSLAPTLPRRTEASKPLRANAPAVIEQHAPVVRMERGADGCRWPEGDPKSENFRFCHAPRPMGRSYCDAHHARAFERRG